MREVWIIFVVFWASLSRAAAAEVAIHHRNPSSRREMRRAIDLAVYMQVGQYKNFDLLTRCILNIISATIVRNADDPYRFNPKLRRVTTLDIHVSFLRRLGVNETDELLQTFAGREGVGSIYVTTHNNRGYDIGPFIAQLNQSITRNRTYDFAFKIHTKSNRAWLKHTVDCLCGSPNHVVSILTELSQRPGLGMLAAQGTVFGSLSERIRVAPFLLQQLFSTQELWLAFEDNIILGMNILHKVIYGQTDPISRGEAIVAAGTMFWVRFTSLRSSELARALEHLERNLSISYRAHGGVEHLIERLIPTVIKRSGACVREMVPAPAILIDDWDRIGPIESLCERDFIPDYIVVKRYKFAPQSSRHLIRLTSEHIYGALKRHKVILSWDASLGDNMDWHEHFNFLLPIFRHKNYVLGNRGPLFIIRNMGAFSIYQGLSLPQLFNVLAQRNGLKGIHIVASITSTESQNETHMLDISANKHIAAVYQLLPRRNATCVCDQNIIQYSSLELLQSLPQDRICSCPESSSHFKPLQVNDVVYILSDIYRGQQAKILKTTDQQDWDSVMKVELQRYIGKPDVFIQFRFLTLIKPSQWWSIPKLTFFLRNENLGTFGILPTAATSSMHWGYPFNIEASLSEWNKECNGAIECNKEYENIATQISETMGEINWCSDVRYKSNPFHDNLILISNTAVDKDSFAFVQRMPTDGNIHRCQILKGNENKFHKIIRKSLQNIPSCMHA